MRIQVICISQERFYEQDRYLTYIILLYVLYELLHRQMGYNVCYNTIVTPKKIVSMTFSKWKEHSQLFFKSLNMSTVCDIYHDLIAMLLYKFECKTFPNSIEHIFTRNRNVHNYGTRQCNKLHVHRVLTNR